MTNKDDRARTWTFIVYPESAPENWRELLDEYHVPWVESPLHDKDINPDGSVKKAHWHVILLFDGKKSYEQVKELTDAINAPIPQKTANTKGLVRYLIHMDNPEKYQYKRDEIVCHSGADVDEYFALSSSSRRAVLWEIVEFIKENEIDNFSDFIGFCLETDNRDWFDVAMNHNTLAINKLLDSIYQKHHPKFEEEAAVLQARIEKAKKMAEKGYSQRKIADTLGVSRPTVAKYLKK
ncbi:replication protein [Ligilactobacillus murinus]|uniref:Replication protein n=1 Tax=Ligilactobacillus murinus TaxID=1622 RepID=A0A4S2E8A9_9LACO|nr:Rep family protein [Ligilactobacillus murinus]TGY51668.1 replication protein [Ligilactobacillus murinus]